MFFKLLYSFILKKIKIKTNTRFFVKIYMPYLLKNKKIKNICPY